MTHRTLIKCVQLQTPARESLLLEYYLLTDYASFDGAGLDLYGVEVVLHRPGRAKPEIRSIRRITPVGSQVLRLLQRLSNGAVTPAALGDVVDDEMNRRHMLPGTPRPSARHMRVSPAR